jgi:hypothetical protein
LRADAANSGKFVAAFYCFLPLDFWPRFPPNDFVGERVSNQITGFPIPESRQKFYSIERMVFRLVAVMVQVL